MVHKELSSHDLRLASVEMKDGEGFGFIMKFLIFISINLSTLFFIIQDSWVTNRIKTLLMRLRKSEDHFFVHLFSTLYVYFIGPRPLFKNII